MYDSKEIGKENKLPLEAGSSGTATFTDRPSTSFDTSQTKSTAGKTLNKPKATKSSGKQRNDIDDNKKCPGILRGFFILIYRILTTTVVVTQLERKDLLNLNSVDCR
ncbi:uncharacterized protein LOC141531672 isoform X1 [Cotesia typhae]|uniref:uncharacterized protein LOC141531672 isoform X1 n=1 Tax=Cotesia typhae TaxID=2053667 RepID=UPI003D692175